MIHVIESEESLKRSERQAEISTRKNIATNHWCLLCNINKDSTDRNKHSIDKYSFTKADTKVNNEHELSKIRWSYWDDDALNLQRLDIQKRLKIKVMQDIFAAEAKVNERNTWINEDEVKSSLHDDFLIRVIENSYSCKQENVNKSTLSRHICIEAKSLLEW